MFSDVFDFSQQRSFVQAIGWYIVFFLLFLLLAFVAGGIVGLLLGVDDLLRVQQVALRLGMLLAVISTGVLGYFLLLKKNLVEDISFVLLVVIAMGLAFMGGSLFSFAVLAYLTTKSSNSMSEKMSD